MKKILLIMAVFLSTACIVSCVTEKKIPNGKTGIDIGAVEKR